MAIYRHLQHQKTSSLEYRRTYKVDVPVNAHVDSTTYSSVPTSAELASITNPPKYIQTSNNWYYELCGKAPATETLDYGEIAISFHEGSECISIKNSVNNIVEFKPCRIDKSITMEYTELNPSLSPTENTCLWLIEYSDIKAANINPATATVTLREISTGKQVVPDVTFNDVEEKVEISIYSQNHIAANKYRVMIIGTSYYLS